MLIPLLSNVMQGRPRSAVHSATIITLISLLIISANSFAQIPQLKVTKLAVTDSLKVEGQNVTSFFTTLSDSNTTNTSTIGDSTISQQKLTQSLIDVINAAGGGSITNNPDEVTITVSGGLLGVKASSLTTSFLDGSHTFDFASGLTSTDIGVNTSSPQSLVDIQGNAGAAGILTLATKELTVVDGDELGRINFNAPLESSGSDAILPAAAIWAEADFTFGAASNRGELVFGTSETSVPVERMRLTSDGKLGIGVASPTEELEIATATHVTVVLNAAQAAQIQIDRGVTTRDAQVIFLTAGAPDWYMGLPDSDLSGDGTEFYISNTNNGVDPRIWIETNGNVGIDNNNPATKLHVVGNITLGDSTTGDVDAIIYFADDASVTAESFMWNDGNDQFEFTDDISVTGNVVVSGNVDGIDVSARASLVETLTNKTLDDFTNTVMSDGEHIRVFNNSGGGFVKGNLVYISGSHAEGLPEVSKTDADAAATMPCVGVVSETIANGDSGDVQVSGKMSGLNTSTLSINDALYVSGTAGASTATKPTGTALIQKMAVVSRVHASLGTFEISGAYRTNDIPNVGTLVGDWVNTANPWAVNEGGTGAATFTDGGILLGSGTSAVTALGAAANGQIPIGDGATDPVLATITGTASEITVTNGAGSITLSLPANVDISNNLTVGDIIIDEAAGVLDFSGATSATITTSGSNIDLTLTPNGTGNIVMSDMVIFATASITLGGPTNNVDVAGVNVLFVDTNGNNVTIGGFIGGVSGQVLKVVVIDTTNNSVLENNEGTGNQDVFLSGGADETRTASYGGWTIVCNGTSWFEVGQ